MARSSVNCFIAIRFGVNDTDAVYRKIKSVVADLGLQPRRIDQIEHIENINLKIISELNEADIAIADLTYARPSVYFEAGYAHRRIPVIYTCRSDHLHGKEDGPKIHFFFDRFNVIFWEDPEDTTFLSRLKSRLQFVIGELVHIPLIEDLRGQLRHLIMSFSNPQNVLQRIDSLHEDLDRYPRVDPSHLGHEMHIKNRLSLYKDVFDMIDTNFSTERPSTREEQWQDLSHRLAKELVYLEGLFGRSKHGDKVMYGSYLSRLYQVYLECMQKLYERPSIEYQEKFQKVKNGLETLIKEIEQPKWT